MLTNLELRFKASFIVKEQDTDTVKSETMIGENAECGILLKQ